MSAIQLNFTLRTSSNCKTVHLLGSWDNYAGQLPLSKDSSKSGGWKGTFRFQGKTLRHGQRYWYYYIMDGYHVSHDPARESVVEPTTGRKLNVLDIPSATATQPTSLPTARDKAKRQSRSLRVDSSVARGRPLSQSEICSPRPQKPQETQKIRNEQFHRATLELLTASLAASRITESDESGSSEEDDSDIDSDSDSDIDSDISSNVASLTSRASNSSSPSSVSSSSSICSCERYGITRAGGRVKLDCGGSRCGYSDGSDCNSESENECRHKSRSNPRRHGMIVRH